MSVKVYKVSSTSLGEHRGSPRLWLEGKVPQIAGFEPGKKFVVTLNKDHVVLQLADDKGTNTVSRKTARGQEIPVIDVHRQELSEIFKGCVSLRVILNRLAKTPSLRSGIRRVNGQGLSA
jgi:DNA (cytosine-5)-methyltransferase 1